MVGEDAGTNTIQPKRHTETEDWSLTVLIHGSHTNFEIRLNLFRAVRKAATVEADLLESSLDVSHFTRLDGI
jgi:hypothetical protein